MARGTFEENMIPLLRAFLFFSLAFHIVFPLFALESIEFYVAFTK